MFNQATQVHSLVKYRRSRCLPVSGTVLVHVGQKVTPTEVVAECLIPTRHILVDVRHALGLRNLEEAEKMINRKVGENLEKNDIIAETGGLFSRVLRAPMPGKIASIKNAQVLLEVESKKLFVQSGLTGQVVEIVKNRGAIIESNGTLIQGVWGNGRVGIGPLMVDDSLIEEELLPSTLGLTARNMVTAAAYCSTEETLLLAAELPLAGLILGSMNPALIPLAQKLEFPIILLEGFGKIKINDYAYDLLIENAQREISINAQKWDQHNGFRPEVSIAGTAEGKPFSEMMEIADGQIARIHTSPYTGQLAIVTSVNDAKTTLPNGIKASTATLILKDGKKTAIPLPNFDMINSDMSSLG